jgi:required for meiotic nuclear division protein 1
MGPSELDRLYARLEAEFELNDRARAIERKLEVVGDAADVLLNLVQDKRSHRLEVAVIVLIGFEILLNLYHLV